MKNLSKIKLHNLSQAEMASKEQSILKGGATYCISVCLDAICACNEVGDGSGNFPLSDSNTANASSVNEDAVSVTIQQDA